MTELVRQRTAHDCAICCIAMATGRTYEDVMAAAGDNYSDQGVRRQAEIIKALGYEQKYNGTREPTGDFIDMHRPWGIGPEFYRRMIWGRRALVSVPSLNNEGGFHMVYWDGRNVLDPSPKKTYGTVEELNPIEVTLFYEGRRPMMNDAQIKHMADRFLGWKLPEHFNPDGGISFKKMFNEHTAHPMKNEPTGTNLFDAQQALAMVRYMVEGLP